MFVAPFFERFIEFTQQFALVLGELDWRFHRDVAIQIAGVTRAHTFDAFAAQPELLASLGAFGQVNGGFTVQSGHRNFAAERRCGETHRNGAVQIVAIALKHFVFFKRISM